MTAADATVANHDLWCAYLRQRWAFWLDPFGILGDAPDQFVSATAARVAQWLTFVGFAPIAWLYDSHATVTDDARHSVSSTSDASTRTADAAAYDAR